MKLGIGRQDRRARLGIAVVLDGRDPAPGLGARDGRQGRKGAEPCQIGHGLRRRLAASEAETARLRDALRQAEGEDPLPRLDERRLRDALAIETVGALICVARRCLPFHPSMFADITRCTSGIGIARPAAGFCDINDLVFRIRSFQEQPRFPFSSGPNGHQGLCPRGGTDLGNEQLRHGQPS